MRTSRFIFVAFSLCSLLSSSAFAFGFGDSVQKLKDKARVPTLDSVLKTCAPDGAKFCQGKSGKDELKCLQGIDKSKLTADCVKALAHSPVK